MRDALVRRVADRANSLALGLAVLSAGALLAQRAVQWYPTYFPAAGLWLVLAVVAPLALRSALVQVAELETALSAMAVDPDRTTAWSTGFLARALSDRRAASVGLGLTVFGAVSIQILYVPWTGVVRVLFLLPVVAFFVLYGFLALVYVGALQWIWAARAVGFRTPALRLPRAEVGRLHRGYFALSVLGTLLYAAGVVVIWVSPGGPALATDVPWGRLWVFPPAAALIGFFLMAQWRLHLILRDARDRSLASLNQRLDGLTEADERAVVAQADEVKSLLDWRDRLWREPVWPLDLRAVMATVLTLLLPTINAVIELLTAGP